MAYSLTEMTNYRNSLVAEANEASERATRDRAMVAEGRHAQQRLDEYESSRDQVDAEIYRLNRLINEQEVARSGNRPRPRRSPFTIGQPELVALAQNARNVAIQAQNIARRSASASRARYH